MTHYRTKARHMCSGFFFTIVELTVSQPYSRNQLEQASYRSAFPGGYVWYSQFSVFTSKGRRKQKQWPQDKGNGYIPNTCLLEVSEDPLQIGVSVPCSLPDWYKNESQKTLNFCGDSLRSFQKYGILSSWYINHSLHPNYKQHMPKSLVTLMHSVLNQF